MKSVVTPLFPTGRIANVSTLKSHWGRHLYFLFPVKHTMILADGTKVCGRDFQVSPGVLEMDSVSKLGISACLIYSTFLPRNEQRFIGSNHAQARDEAEQHLVQGIQGIIASNARDRAYRKQVDAQMAEWRNRQSAWGEER